MKALLLQTVYIAARTGQGAADPTYGAPASRATRIELRKRSVKTADGYQKTTEYLAFFESSVGLHDRIWLPGTYTAADDGRHRLPTAVEEVVDWTGTSTHFEVRF